MERKRIGEVRCSLGLECICFLAILVCGAMVMALSGGSAAGGVFFVVMMVINTLVLVYWEHTETFEIDENFWYIIRKKYFFNKEYYVKESVIPVNSVKMVKEEFCSLFFYEEKRRVLMYFVLLRDMLHYYLVLFSRCGRHTSDFLIWIVYYQNGCVCNRRIRFYDVQLRANESIWRLRPGDNPEYESVAAFFSEQCELYQQRGGSW